MTHPNKLCLGSVKDDFTAQDTTNPLVGSNHFGSILNLRIE